MCLRNVFLTLYCAICVSSLCIAEQPNIPRVIRNADEVVVLGNGELRTLHKSVLHGVDFRAKPIAWSLFNVRGAVFIGCQFRNNDGDDLAARGALIFPVLPDLPYNPYRNSLYTPKELREGTTASFNNSLDSRIYGQFLRLGGTNPDVLESLAERIHDDSIEQALRDHLKNRKVVAILGSHSLKRSMEEFKKVAQLAQLLTKEGYFVSTGGGPGVMEAGNVGAYLGGYPVEAVDDAWSILKLADDNTKPEYDEQAYKVLNKYPKGSDSIAIPTWFYGNEPSNLFASHDAKYFSNSLREDILLSTAKYGAVFAPGGAGTMQEVFMTNTSNSYKSYGYQSPMVFLGKEGYKRVFPLVQELAADATYPYANMLSISDDPAELVKFLKSNPPTPIK